MSEDLTGRRLGHYRIDGVIGRGGMSVLYRATDMRLGRTVALKVIGEALAADPEFRERFVDEARNTSAIDHAHVVPLYDFDQVDGRLYIAMRYVEGSDLASLIKDGPISSQRTLALLAQVADALDALHARGLVHLDVKPANVLVTPNENAGTEHVYLADFGLTRRGATGHRTRSGDFLGSPTYAAPEHLRGEPVDGRTDQYSLTCVLFCCLTGRAPFVGQVPEVIAGHLGGQPPAVTSLALLPAAIDDVVRRGMAKRPADRFDSCRELIAAARAALSAPPSSTPVAPTGPGPVPSAPFRVDLAATPGASPAVPPQVSAAPPAWIVPAPPLARPPAPRPPASRPYQPPGYGPPTGRPPPLTTPIRLRDPLPAQSPPFQTGGGSRWLVPAVLAVVAAGVVVLVVVLLMSGRGTGGGGAPGPSPTPAPSVNMQTTSERPLPTQIPTVTR